jgi:hypothetical protein
MNYRNPKYYILPAILLGVIILMTVKAEFNWIKNQFSTPSIDFKHEFYPYTDKIYSGEQLRFFIVGTECEHVIWLFDEDEDNFRSGNKEVDYAFPYDDNRAPDISITHRVDAFCRKGDTYKSAMKRVTVLNRMVIGELNEANKKLQITVASTIKDLRLKKIAMTDNTTGIFSEFDNLLFYQNSENVDRKKNTTIFDLSLTPSSTKSLVENSKSLEMWLRYEFINGSDENMIFFQRLKDIIQHH